MISGSNIVKGRLRDSVLILVDIQMLGDGVLICKIAGVLASSGLQFLLRASDMVHLGAEDDERVVIDLLVDTKLSVQVLEGDRLLSAVVTQIMAVSGVDGSEIPEGIR